MTEAGKTLKFEPTRKRIRILLGGELVADTTDAMLVWEVPYYPAYYVPARDVRAGDMLRVKNDSGEFHVEVLALSEMRGPAAVAQTLYRETEASKELRLKVAEERKTMPGFEAWREGKPSKRDRREIDRLRRRE